MGYFNYYLALGRDTVTGTYRYPPPDGRYMELTKDGDDEVVGYMYDRITYDERNKNSAIDVIQNGIKKFPDRLDMRFGLIHTLQQIGEYENQSLVLKSALRYSLTNNNQWAMVSKSTNAWYSRIFSQCNTGLLLRMVTSLISRKPFCLV